MDTYILNNIVSTEKTRDFYKGKSLDFAGQWSPGKHYFNDDYSTNFVVYAEYNSDNSLKGSVLLACKKNHVSRLESDTAGFQPQIEYDANNGIVGIKPNEHWAFICGSLKGENGKNYIAVDTKDNIPVQKNEGEIFYVKDTGKLFVVKENNKVEEIIQNTEHNDDLDTLESTLRGEINKKVTSEVGKQLSSNDFTDHYKDAIDNFPAEIQRAIDNNRATDTSVRDLDNRLSAALDTKIDKEAGKGLSTNDYTDADKRLLYDINSHRQENVIESISVDGDPQRVNNKNVDLHIPEYTIEETPLTPAEQLNWYRRYTLYKDSKKLFPDINIPWEHKLLAGEVRTVLYTNLPYDGAQPGDPYMIFYTSKGDTISPVYVPCKKLVAGKWFTAGNGINIDENLEISVDVDSIYDQIEKKTQDSIDVTYIELVKLTLLEKLVPGRVYHMIDFGYRDNRVQLNDHFEEEQFTIELGLYLTAISNNALSERGLAEHINGYGWIFLYKVKYKLLTPDSFFSITNKDKLKSVNDDVRAVSNIPSDEELDELFEWIEQKEEDINNIQNCTPLEEAKEKYSKFLDSISDNLGKHQLIPDISISSSSVAQQTYSLIPSLLNFDYIWLLLFPYFLLEKGKILWMRDDGNNNEYAGDFIKNKIFDSRDICKDCIILGDIQRPVITTFLFHSCTNILIDTNSTLRVELSNKDADTNTLNNFSRVTLINSSLSLSDIVHCHDINMINSNAIHYMAEYGHNFLYNITIRDVRNTHIYGSDKNDNIQSKFIYYDGSQSGNDYHYNYICFTPGSYPIKRVYTYVPRRYAIDSYEEVDIFIPTSELAAIDWTDTSKGI